MMEDHPVQPPRSLYRSYRVLPQELYKTSAEDLAFRDTDYFIAGEIHQHYNVWEQILHGYHKQEESLKYISEGVSVFHFFQHFKGQFKRNSYDSSLPPRMFFEKNKICNDFQDFISSILLERVANGSLSMWGKEGECEPLHLVMPITIEPSKPRMCHDERFLNLWMNTPHVSFDKITDIPRYVDANHFQSKLNDKSGYDHISLTEDSRTFFGLYWKGWFFVFTTLPFGWSPSEYIYHSTGIGASHFIRSNGVSVSQYIDDRHVGQLRLLPCFSSDWSDLDLANAAVFISAFVLISWGYFIGIKVLPICRLYQKDTPRICLILHQFNLYVLLIYEKKLVTIKLFLFNFFWGVKMCDKMAISTYIMKIAENDPFLRLQMRAIEMFNRQQFVFL